MQDDRTSYGRDLQWPVERSHKHASIAHDSNGETLAEKLK